MNLKPKKLLLNTRQPTGMWVILFTSILYTMSTTTIIITFEDYILNSAPYLNYLSKSFDLSLYSNLFLFSFASVIGGILGYNIGHKRSVLIGIFYSCAGLILLTINNLALIGFSAYIIGVGVTVPNLYTTLSFLYTQDDPRRHAGFTLVYIATIVGAALAIVITDLFARHLGYQSLYLIMAVASIIGALTFLYASATLNKSVSISDNIDAKFTPSVYSVIFILIVLSTLISYLLDYIYVLEGIILIVAAIAFILMCLYSFFEKDYAQRKRIIALITLSILAGCYWFIDKNILIIFLYYLRIYGENANMGIPEFISSNFIFEANIVLIVIIGIIMAGFWNKNKHQKHIIQITRFFSLALLISAVACLFIALSFFLGKSASYLLLITVALNSIAKVILLPLYYAIVGKLSPRKYESIIMGFFFLFTAAIGILSIYVNNKTISSQAFHRQELGYLYSYFFIGVLITAILAFALSKIWKKYLKSKQI
ncbi:MFS transporter [Fangia hongkongensis]|uniref:MFS transporter n=3 Tax=Fangia hongkongensis TaxID=270495 RepID=UPI000A02690A|nr:MFS transporter [Fangia hongkongensis]